MQKDIWICIEKGEANCSAYAPAVPGCVSTGGTVEEAKRNMAGALALHLAGMLEDGAPLDGVSEPFPPERASGDEYFALVRVDVAARSAVG